MAEHESVVGALSAGEQLNAALLHDLIERMDALLDALAEHIEDCEKLFECLIHSENKKERSRQFRLFTKPVEAYATYLQRRVNHIKHCQGRIRWVCARAGGGVHLAYFFESVVKPGTVGPHPVFHKKVQALSFARSLRYHLFHVYELAACLVSAVEQVCPLDPPGEERPVSTSVDALGAVRAVSELPRLIFPGEQRMEWPEVRQVGDADSPVFELSISIKLPDDVSELPSGSRVTTIFDADGTPNQSFIAPLLGRDQR